jgi:hypothetical protein
MSACDGSPRDAVGELRIVEGSHKVTLNGRQTVVPRHPADLPPGTLRAIMRQLSVSATDLEVSVRAMA